MKLSCCIGKLGLVVGTLAMSTTVFGGTNGFMVPPFRGLPNSEFGYWEVFAKPSGSPGNFADQAGATSGAELTQSDTNAFLTGSGNIYNFGISSFLLTDATPFALGTVVMQTRTIGSELEYASVLLAYTNDTGAHVLAPSFRYEPNRSPAQGYSVSSIWQWNLTGLAISNYSIALVAGGPSLSFDSLMLDATADFQKVFPEQPFSLQSTPATLARWNYPFNGNPGGRQTASVFGSLGSAPDFDSRDAQFLLGWNTSNSIPAAQGVTNYLIRRARVTLTIAPGSQYTYVNALRDYRTYFPTNDSRSMLATNVSSPLELFGAGFRGGYASTNYPQAGPWGIEPNVYASNRIAFAAGFDTNGVLVDVSNSVGDDGTNEIAAPFEVAPFAIGQTTNIASGQVVPAGSQFTFELNLNDPFIYGYVQKGLNDGNLSFMVSSLVDATLSGPPTYPNFYTIFSATAEPHEVPILNLEGEVLRASVDSDTDGLPDDWENFYFGSLAQSATNNVDGDAANNSVEFQTGTAPSSASSLLQIISVRQNAGVAEIHFVHAPGRHYSIAWSDDLQNWQTVSNPTLTYSSAWLSKSEANPVYPSRVYAVWRDLNAGSAHRFYRVVAQ